MRQLPKIYFDNKVEQSKIKQALLDAIPHGVYYHNAILALADLLGEMVESEYDDEMMGKKNARVIKERMYDQNHE